MGRRKVTEGSRVPKSMEVKGKALKPLRRRGSSEGPSRPARQCKGAVDCYGRTWMGASVVEEGAYYQCL